MVRTSPVVLLLILITLVTSAPIRADPVPRSPRLRLTDPRLHTVVDAGRRQSPSFRALVGQLGFTRNRGSDRADFDSVAAIDAGITIWRELAERDAGE